MSKMIPALIFKNESDMYEIDVFQFEEREILVRNLYPVPEYVTISKIIYDESQKDLEDIDAKFVSCMDMKPKFEFKYNSDEIKIMNASCKRISYTTSVEINRNYKFEKLPHIKITETGGELDNQVTWKSSIRFEM